MMSFFTLVALAARCIPRALLIFTPPMQRTFLTNLALLLVLNLLVKPFYLLGIDAGVQDAVGASAYGSYAALLSLSFLLNIVLDLGLTNYNTRNIAQHTHLMGKYLSGVIGVRMVLAGLYALLTVVVGLVLGYSGEQLGVLGWLVLNQALVASILYLRSNIAGAQRFRQDSLLSVLDRVLLIAAVGWLLWARGGDAPFRIEWFVWAQTAAYGATLLVALVMTLRLSGKVRMGWNPTFSRVVLKQSFPYALLILLMTFYYRTDTLMLERMLPDGAFQAGIYAQGFRFFEAFNMLGYLFAGLLLPIFSRQLKYRESVAPLVVLALRLVLGGSLAVAAFVHWNALPVLELIYDQHAALSAPSFVLLIHCFVGVCVTYVFGTLLTASGDLRLLNWMAAGGVLLNVALNLLLIPRYQAEGAAWASLITQMATALVQVLLAARANPLHGHVGMFIRGGAHGGALFLFAWATLSRPFQERVGWFLCAGLISAYLTGLVTPKVLRQAMKLPAGR
jgi:O-antigen/teichoic acid export membrane protein